MGGGPGVLQGEAEESNRHFGYPYPIQYPSLQGEAEASNRQFVYPYHLNEAETINQGPESDGNTNRCRFNCRNDQRGGSRGTGRDKWGSAIRDAAVAAAQWFTGGWGYQKIPNRPAAMRDEGLTSHFTSMHPSGSGYRGPVGCAGYGCGTGGGQP